MYAEIILPQRIGNTSTLTYSVPDELELKLGQIVTAPLRGRTISGVVWKTIEEKPEFRTLPIKEIIKLQPIFSENQLKLIRWISEYYFCPLHKIFSLFIPKRILDNKPIKRRKQKEEQINRTKPKKLNEEQEKAVTEILKSEKNKFLIHGITGSGKTEIYCRLAEDIINKNKQVLILVPEISLTPQTIEYFQKTIGIKASVIHSKLSPGERQESWININSNQTKLIIGSRSSIFAPFKNLGLIIVDEEHEQSYKQDNSPRYHTHKVAEKMQELDPELKIIFGSATPSIETAEKLKNSTIHLKNRIGTKTLPEVKIIDLREEFQKKNYSIFSDDLSEELEKTLKRKEQAILFINRRGSASSVVCRDCGDTENCKNCDIPLTYHSKTIGKPVLICHHCGIIAEPPATCKNCLGTNIRFLGGGTQKIETETAKHFPDAKLLRADKDTTSQKNSFKEIYQDFKNQKADILIGTQMIAKGLHLPNVSLVAVILADIGLNLPDFRTNERNFQLITQVSGRAGRGEAKGKVMIQTYNPENIALKFSKNNDYEGLFNYEISQRKLLQYPPFANMAKLLIEEKVFSKVQTKAEELENQLWKIAREENLTENLEINTYPAYMARLKGKFRYIVLIKTPPALTAHKLLVKLPEKYIMDPNIKIDIDPLSIT